MGRAVDKLAELLDEANERIAELEQELEQLRSYQPWTEHEEIEPDSLPVPRLEMRWEKGRFANGYQYRCLYRLVYRHLLGHLEGVPLGCTMFGSSRDPTEYGQHLNIPFRDGAHIRSDAKHLGLPAFVRWHDRVDRLETE